MNKKQLDDLSPAELKSYIQRGIIHVNMDTTAIPTRIEETPEYLQYKDLKGNKIHLGKASRKYGIDPKTLSRWIQKGFIKTRGTEGQKVYLDESYVAYCAYVYCQSPGKGRWAFTKEGLPRSAGVNLRS